MKTTQSNHPGMLTGLFYDRASAERAYGALSDRGYNKDDINVVMSDEARKRHFSDEGTTTELGNKAAEGAGIGGAVGGTLGAVLAAVTATGTSLALPGLGLVIAGPLAAAAAGAGAGAATGGLLGALVGWGIPEERVKHYESGLKDGGILMGVKPRSEEDASYFENHWRTNNGQQIYRNDGMSTAGDSTSTQQNRLYDTGNMQAGSQHGDTVVAVYDSHVHAQQAMSDLMTAGYSRDRVRLTPAGADMNDANEVSGQRIDGDQMSYSGVKSRFNLDYLGDHDMYSEAVRRGSYVVSVDTSGDDDVARAMEIMGRHDAIDIEERATHWRNEGWSGYDASAPVYTRDQIDQERNRHAQLRSTTEGTESARIPVIEEELKVGKRQVQRGGVRVIKRVIETPVHETVQLREEHVRVERHRVDQPATEADLAAFKDQSIELHEMAEEAVVSKTAHVVEEVVIGKEVTQETQNIQDTVRRTDVEVEQIGATGTTGRVSDDEDFRRHWQTAYGDSGGRYEDYDAAYRYGSTMAGNDRYKNYQWNDVEPQLRNDWEANHPGSTWDKVKDAVRYGAERVTGNRRH